MSKLTEGVVPMYRHMVGKYGQGPDGRGILRPEDEDDLVHTIIVESLRAEERYTGENGATWVTYAKSVAKGVIDNYLRRQSNTVVPRSEWLGRQMGEVYKATKVLQQRLLREPTNREIAAAIGMTIEEFEELRSRGDYTQVYFEDLSLDGDDEGGEPLEWEAMVDGGAMINGPEAEAMEAEVADVLEGFLSCVRPEERQALVLLYCLDGQGERTLREAGDIMGVSYPTVMRLRDKAIRKIKNRGLGDALLRQIEHTNRGGRDNA